MCIRRVVESHFFGSVARLRFFGFRKRFTWVFWMVSIHHRIFATGLINLKSTTLNAAQWKTRAKPISGSQLHGALGTNGLGFRV